MADSQLRILIDALWRGGGDTRRARGDIRDLARESGSASAQMRGLASSSEDAGQAVQQSGQGAQSSGLRWTELASKVSLVKTGFDIAREAGEQVYGLLREGAALENAEIRFGRLATSIGTTATALERDLGTALRGQLSNAEAVAAATEIMTLGLTKTHDQTVRLTRATSALGADMNQVTLALTNQTTARFDQIGIAVDGFDEKLKALEAQGLSTEDAFTEAFLQQAEEQIERVGDVADTTQGKLRRLENRARDASDAFKRWVLEAAMPAIDGMVRLADAQDTLDAAVARGLITQREAFNIQKQLAIPAQKEATDATIEHLNAQLAAGDAAWSRAAAEDALRRAMSDGQATRQEYLEQTVKLSEAHKELVRQQEEGRREADDFSESLDRLRRGQGEGIVLQFSADTAPARTELEDLITDFSGRQIPFEVLPTLRGRGDEKAQGEEVLRPVKEALGGIFDQAVLELQPQIDMRNLIEMEETMGNIITNSDYINTTPVEPEVHNQDVNELLDGLGRSREELDGIIGGNPYEVETQSNVPDLNSDLEHALGLIRAIEGTHHVRIVTTHSGNPHTGPYDTGGGQGGPQFNAPPSLGFNEFQQFGGASVGTLQINVTESGDPRRTAEEVVRHLEDRGVVRRLRLR